MEIDKGTILKDLNGKLREKFAGDLKEVILFGSRVSGKAHTDSDYDLLIILR